MSFQCEITCGDDLDGNEMHGLIIWLAPTKEEAEKKANKLIEEINNKLEGVKL